MFTCLYCQGQATILYSIRIGDYKFCGKQHQLVYDNLKLCPECSGSGVVSKSVKEAQKEKITVAWSESI